MSKQPGGRDEPTVMIEMMPEEKYILRAHATDLHPELERQLADGRYRWIAFTQADLDDITGELSYICNRSNNGPLIEELDALCLVLEQHLHQMDEP
ncbi:MAG: hypothetical protein EA402_12330 [Planctomycetota bacterium]|nr:MAG: hypothetical protein EA402_12330 [Planctomycetota bacterium]